MDMKSSPLDGELPFYTPAGDEVALFEHAWRNRMPLLIKGAPFGLIYADKNQMGSIMLTEADLSVLRALREEAVAAFRRGA